jgi:hypothetical protein
MKRLLTAGLPLGVILAVTAFLAIARLQATPVTQAPSSDEKLKTFMQLKLDHAKGILEGIATEDFEQIAKEVQALTALSLQSSWNTYSTPDYLNHSSDFRRAMDVIHKAAHEQNLDRAALGYVNLTVQCIECHRYLRLQNANNQAKPK